MRLVNKLTKPGDIRRIDLLPDTVRVETVDGQSRLYRLVSAADEDGVITDNMRDHWKHQNLGAGAKQ